MKDDFIAVFDDVFSKEECLSLINYFEELKKLDLTFDRQTVDSGNAHDRSDETAFLFEPQILSLDKTNPIVSPFFKKFWNCYEQYAKHYSVLIESEMHGINSVRLQKTLPAQGYHRWHYENSNSATSRRVIAWMIYLNDIENGGETEFLYLSKRVTAKQGRVLIWPAGFTHTHRGNPPLTNEKYILTGWLEFMGKS